MKKKKEFNPMSTKKGAWLWLLCAPAALIISAHYDAKKNKNKRAEKKERKEAEFRKNWGLHDEFDWWQDNQGL